MRLYWGRCDPLQPVSPAHGAVTKALWHPFLSSMSRVHLSPGSGFVDSAEVKGSALCSVFVGALELSYHAAGSESSHRGGAHCTASAFAPHQGSLLGRCWWGAGREGSLQPGVRVGGTQCCVMPSQWEAVTSGHFGEGQGCDVWCVGLEEACRAG
jgi:hypothetical protein